MEKEVSGIELLQMIYNKKLNNEKIYSKSKKQEFHWDGRNLINNNNNCYFETYKDIDFINDTFIVYIELTADELFEQLGYEKFSDDGYSFEYRKISDDDLFEINFWKKDKTISKNYYREIGYITRKELQAINKKVEELGWLQ